MDSETAGKMRSIARRIVITSLNDKGQSQTVNVQGTKNSKRQNVEVLQPFGFASHAPVDGAISLAIAVGADEGDLAILPPSNPSQRFGDMVEGASVIYSSEGDYVLIKPDGTLKISVADKVTINAKNGVTIKTDSVKIEGGTLEVDKDVHFKGNLKVDGDIEDKQSTMQAMRKTFNSHTHPDKNTVPDDKMG